MQSFYIHVYKNGAKGKVHREKAPYGNSPDKANGETIEISL